MNSAAGSAAGQVSVDAQPFTTPHWLTTHALSACCWRLVRHDPNQVFSDLLSLLCRIYFVTEWARKRPLLRLTFMFLIQFYSTDALHPDHLWYTEGQKVCGGICALLFKWIKSLLRDKCSRKMQLSPERCQCRLKQTNRTWLYRPPEGKSPSGWTQYLYLLFGCVLLNLYLTAALLVW